PFSQLMQTAQSLVRINHEGAEREVQRIRASQQKGLLVIGAGTLGGTLLALLLAAGLLRSMRRQDELVRQSSVQMEQRNRELDAFAGRVAHDLRGPLTTINLSAERLAERVPQEEGAMAILKRGVAHMESLIQDLLALSALDAQIPDTASQI